MTITILLVLFILPRRHQPGFFIFSSPIFVCQECESLLAFYLQKSYNFGHSKKARFLDRNQIKKADQPFSSVQLQQAKGLSTPTLTPR